MAARLLLEYDGSEFAGWARQPGERTVEEALEGVLRTVLGDSGSDGLPLISYVSTTSADHASTNDLKVAHCGNVACTSAT